MPLVFSITDVTSYIRDETGCAGRRYPTQAAVARCFLAALSNPPPAIDAALSNHFRLSILRLATSKVRSKRSPYYQSKSWDEYAGWVNQAEGTTFITGFHRLIFPL